MTCLHWQQPNYIPDEPIHRGNMFTGATNRHDKQRVAGSWDRVAINTLDLVRYWPVITDTICIRNEWSAFARWYEDSAWWRLYSEVLCLGACSWERFFGVLGTTFWISFMWLLGSFDDCVVFFALNLSWFFFTRYWARVDFKEEFWAFKRDSFAVFSPNSS
jgi:hypothetical protein